jgi:hypothetical protein
MHFLPALLGVPLVEIDGDYRQLLTHSVKLGGLAIRNPVDTAPRVHKASLAATRHLTVSLVDPATRFDPGAHGFPELVEWYRPVGGRVEG